MKRGSKLRFGRMPILMFSVFVGSGVAFASGSYSSGGGDMANQAYNLGKAAFYKKLICSSCPLANADPDAKQAADIVKQLSDSTLKANLADQERDAVIQYLKRRYDLN